MRWCALGLEVKELRLGCWMATWSLDLSCVISDGSKTMPGTQLIDHWDKHVMERKECYKPGKKSLVNMEQ